MRAAAALLLALAAGRAAADPVFEQAALAATPDAEWGAYLASECLTCHRPSGVADGVPVISGWPRDAFIHALAGYRAGHRSNQVMEMVARSMAPDEASSIAAFFETLTD